MATKAEWKPNPVRPDKEWRLESRGVFSIAIEEHQGKRFTYCKYPVLFGFTDLAATTIDDAKVEAVALLRAKLTEALAALG